MPNDFDWCRHVVRSLDMSWKLIVHLVTPQILDAMSQSLVKAKAFCEQFALKCPVTKLQSWRERQRVSSKYRNQLYLWYLIKINDKRIYQFISIYWCITISFFSHFTEILRTSKILQNLAYKTSTTHTVDGRNIQTLMKRLAWHPRPQMSMLNNVCLTCHVGGFDFFCPPVGGKVVALNIWFFPSVSSTW